LTEMETCVGGAEDCARCMGGYHLEDRYEENKIDCEVNYTLGYVEDCITHTQVCIENRCNCRSGSAAPNHYCTKHNTELCASCAPGYYLKDPFTGYPTRGQGTITVAQYCAPQQCSFDFKSVGPHFVAAPGDEGCREKTYFIDYGGWVYAGLNNTFGSAAMQGSDVASNYCLVQCAPGYAPCSTKDKGADGRKKCPVFESPDFEPAYSAAYYYGLDDRWGRTYVLCGPGDEQANPEQGKLLFFDYGQKKRNEEGNIVYPLYDDNSGAISRFRGDGYCQEISCSCEYGVPKIPTLNCGEECTRLCHEGIRDQCETCYPGYALTSQGVCVDFWDLKDSRDRECYAMDGNPNRNFWSSDGDIVSPDEAPCGCALYAERTACLDPEPTPTTPTKEFENMNPIDIIYDCLGVPNGRAQMEACGCGDDTSCRDCRGVPDGPAQMKVCGCDDDSSCRDCNGVPYGTAVELACGCMESCPDGEGRD